MVHKLHIQDTDITVVEVNAEDYLCLTDMLKAKDGEFAAIRNQAGLNSF